MKAIVEGACAILAGDADVVVAGGAENMSAAPYSVSAARWGARMNNTPMTDIMVNDGLWNVYNNYHMGITAENICDQWGITREELDQFACNSQIKTKAAQEAGRFNDEIVPIVVKQKKAEVEFKVDEHPRPSKMEALAKLRPAFMKDGRVTAGNASGINDGAAAVVIASEEAVKKYKKSRMELHIATENWMLTVGIRKE